MNLAADSTFRAIAVAVVPEASKLAAAEWAAFDSIVARALARRPRRMQRQLALFVRLLNVIAWLRFQRPLRRLLVAERVELLTRVQDSRLLLLRRGFWGLRTLVFMGYYARPECAHTVGYAAAPRGWELRR